MTINTTVNRWEYTGTGGAIEFGYTNKIFVGGELEVYLDGTLRTLNTHYTVDGVGDADGGNVTFVTAPLVGVLVVINRVVGMTQGSAFPSGGAFPSSVVEDALDRAMIIDQQQQEQFDRTLNAPVTDPIGVNVTLPAAASRAGKVLAFDPTTGAVVASTQSLETLEAPGTAADVAEEARDAAAGSAGAASGFADAALSSEEAAAVSAAVAANKANATALGVDPADDDMGTFAGDIVSAGKTAKEALQAIVAALKIVQVVQTADTTVVSTTSSTMVTTGISATITPQSINSKVRVLVSLTAGGSSSVHAAFTVKRNGTDLVPAGATELRRIASIAASNTYGVVMDLLDAPAAITAQTYTIHFSDPTNSGTVHINRRGADLSGANVTTITLEEIL